jgi:hypothetical protein
MLSDFNGLTARTMTRSSSPDRGEERFDTGDVHHASEVVGEHVQRHLSRHFGQRLHQKVRRPHPHLQRAKRMLDCLATSTHCIRTDRGTTMSARLVSLDQKRTELTPGTVLVREWDRHSPAGDSSYSPHHQRRRAHGDGSWDIGRSQMMDRRGRRRSPVEYDAAPDRPYHPCGGTDSVLALRLP